MLDLLKISKNNWESSNYDFILDSKTKKKIIKAIKKDNKKGIAIGKQLIKISNNPYHFKPLRNEMKNIRRVHIKKSFVLTYEVDEKDKTITILDFAHHDVVYQPILFFWNVIQNTFK